MTTTTELEGLVLHAVKTGGKMGVTLDDIVSATGLDKVTASPRLKPLETKGFITRDGKRLGFGTRKQTVWKVV